MCFILDWVKPVILHICPWSTWDFRVNLFHHDVTVPMPSYSNISLDVTQWLYQLSCQIINSNMTFFKRFWVQTCGKNNINLNLWRHRQFIMIFYQFLHIRIEIIHGSHIYILFLPRVGLYVSFLSLADARDKTSWHKGLPMVKTIYKYGFHELFLK